MLALSDISGEKSKYFNQLLQGCPIETHSWSDWHQLGQIFDFLILVSSFCTFWIFFLANLIQKRTTEEFYPPDEFNYKIPVLV